MREASKTSSDPLIVWLSEIVSFLNEIGIDTQAAPLADECFLPGVRIDAGTLKFDTSRLLAASDLLHEAGHIAVTPECRRSLLGGQLNASEDQPHGGEVEAIAWSFAAAQYLRMPLDVLFHPEGYRGHAPALAFNFALGVYPGVHGLVCAGLALSTPIGNRNGYPKLIRWLRE